MNDTTKALNAATKAKLETTIASYRHKIAELEANNDNSYIVEVGYGTAAIEDGIKKMSFTNMPQHFDEKTADHLSRMNWGRIAQKGKNKKHHTRKVPATQWYTEEAAALVMVIETHYND